MTIVHIVLFEFSPIVHKKIIDDVCQRMLALQDKCIHPTTKQPYILESSGGRDNSPEGHQGGFSHAFVSLFASVEDRNYYLAKDPAHQEFVRSLDGIVQNLRVIDYEPGTF